MKQPTCAATGYRNYTCSKCGHTKNSATLAKVPNHTWNRSAANCTTPKKCTTCGTVGQSALGHACEWVTVKQPTCGETGYRNYKCTRSGCGAVLNSATLDKVPNHSWNVSAATCTVAKTCTICKTTAQSATGHSYTWVTMKQPTCTETGYRNYKCTKSGCTSVLNSATIDKIPHSWDRSAATCTADKKCKTCGTVGQKALGHAYTWVVMKQPTCTETGYRNKTCSRCQNVRNSATLDKVPHTFTKKVIYSEASAEYKAGGTLNGQNVNFYNNLTNVTLTGNMRTDLVAVAASQVGYTEGDNTAGYSGTTVGEGNYTEYGRWNYATNGKGGKTNHYWCASFIAWCARRANIPTSYISNSAGAADITNSCSYKKVAAKDVRDGEYIPLPGDLVHIQTTNEKGEIQNHVEIVKSYDANNKKLLTIGGNTSAGESGSQNNGGGAFERNRWNYLQNGKIVKFGVWVEPGKETIQGYRGICTTCGCK